MASVAFVLPFGEPEEAYFADTLLTLLAADARRSGHQAHVVRVYYHGRDTNKDREIRALLRQYLDETGADLVVVERLFDAEPVLAGARRVLQVTRGDSMEPVPGIRHALGMVTEPVPGRPARRSPSVADLRQAFRELLGALERGQDLGSVAGVATFEDGELTQSRPLPTASADGPFDPVLDAHVIAPGAPPALRHKTLLGNVGCPFADDPLENPHYAGAELPSSLPVARLGCAFCHMGGDYEKRPDAAVVASLVEQAAYFARALPEVRSFVLSDQHALRYLAELVRAAAEGGLRGVRWLFPARPDAFVRERARIAEAAQVAAEVGHVVEVYLSGFEAFSDRELGRYNKGCNKADLVEAVRQMRALGSQYPRSFEHAGARAHSTVLWNPWTAPADVRESVDTIREHDLGELFHEVGRNRLRLYRELPIYWAAKRDGAVQETWQPGDGGSARRKGYSSEIPWRFLDARTRVAHDVAAQLRDRLGLETELDQLEAALDFAERGGDGWEVCEAGLARLEAQLAKLLAPNRAADQPERGRQTRAVPCILRQSTRHEAVESALAQALELGRPLFVVGVTHPSFAALAKRASALAALVDPDTLPGALAAGARALSVRVTSIEARLPSSGVAVEARVHPVGDHLGVFPAWARWAAGAGMAQLRVEISLPALGLARLGEAADALSELASECRALGVALEVAPLAAGLGDYRFVPVEKPPPP